ncbi:MAG: hypothetical protein A2157_03085 [Deltaproteobacteria bacterium RBG_16_47_11]|nr:MAG: hypothetical protein A2157_03085 [Deltaproteobacteria bacterium RBG_16_47_11]
MLLDDVRHYYVTSGIAAETFKCPMEPSCRSACVDFIGTREAFVGSEYERGLFPRILFVSLDPARDLSGRDPALRTIASMRRWAEAAEPSPSRPGDHWHETRRFAYSLLAPVAPWLGLPGVNERRIGRYFAHTNSAKCKDAAKGTDQGRNLLFRNCRRFIPGEVTALHPMILVTQGAPARASVQGAFPVIVSAQLRADPQYGYEVLLIAGKPVLKFSMTHPKARFGRYQREVGAAWSWYMNVGQTFAVGGVEALNATFA